MRKKTSISLLTTTTSIFTGYYIEKLLEQDILIHSILFDSKTATEQDRKKWQERTKGQLPLIPLDQFEKYHIPCYYFSNHSSEEMVEFVKESHIDLLVNIGTPRILKKNTLTAPMIGVLNCHPGILPDFRGCTNVEWAIFLDEEIGNTVHLMTEEIDEGPVIIQENLLFKKSDKYHDIRMKVYRHSFSLMARGVRRIIESENDCSDKEYQKNGRYFAVIDEEKMKIAMEKVNNGQYFYQK